MRYRELDLNLLLALDRLIQLRSVSQAAVEMAVTQSAMSNMLARLRDYFDDPLLVQFGRRMEPTARALALAEPIRDILVRIEATVKEPAEFDPFTSTRSFTLMLSDYSLMSVIPELNALVAKHAPGVRLTFVPQTAEPSLQVEQGGADLVIAPAVFCGTAHPSETLLHDPLVCILDAANPAIDRFDEATFLSLQHVIMQPPGDANSYADRVLQQAGLHVDVRIRTYSFASLPWLVRGTDRVATVQSLVAASIANDDQFVVLPCPVDVEPLEQRVLWHKLKSQDSGLNWLVYQLKKAATLLCERHGIQSF